MSRLHLKLQELKTLYTSHLLLKEITLPELSLTILSLGFLVKKQYAFELYEKNANDKLLDVTESLIALFLALEDRYINSIVSYRIGFLSNDVNSEFYTTAYQLLMNKKLSTLSGLELFYLGLILYYGRGGILKNQEESLKYYHLSGDKGYEKAYVNIGCYYRDINLEKAVSYFEKGVSLNGRESKTHLAYMLEFGAGVKMDKPYAYQLYVEAAQQGNQYSIKKCEQLDLNYHISK